MFRPMNAGVAVVLLLGSALAFDNGLARLPPMGWRSWNAFLNNINQDNIFAQVVAMSSPVGPQRLPSLLSLGFQRVGIDDAWQACGTGVNGSFHDINGNPLVNLTRFPDMLGMNRKAKNLGIKMGWYGNNCDCSEHGTPHYVQDANATAFYEYDGLKVDGCGSAHNITDWVIALNGTGRPILLENCGDNHNSWSPPTPDELAGAPGFNLYRICDDIAPQFYSTMWNLQHQTQFRQFTRPGLWSYPDMLQVGNLVTFEESRAHFAAWCISSAPLILGFDLSNSGLLEAVYPIIGNKDLIAISQDWNGDPGHLVMNSSTYFTAPVNHGAGNGTGPAAVLPDYQVWLKPLTAGVAVLFLNIGSSPQAISVPLNQLGLPSPVSARDVYAQQPLPDVTDSLTATIPPHDSFTWVLTPL